MGSCTCTLTLPDCCAFIVPNQEKTFSIKDFTLQFSTIEMDKRSNNKMYSVFIHMIRDMLDLEIPYYDTHIAAMRNCVIHVSITLQCIYCTALMNERYTYSSIRKIERNAIV